MEFFFKFNVGGTNDFLSNQFYCVHSFMNESVMLVSLYIHISKLTCHLSLELEKQNVSSVTITDVDQPQKIM